MKRMALGMLILAAVAAVSYLSAVGCCHLMGWGAKGVFLSDRLGLSAEQKTKISSLEGAYLQKKKASCELLCNKRAQMIQTLKQPQPDAAVLYGLAEEIGNEQTSLEKATLEHLLRVSRHLDEGQKQKLFASVSEELRNACKRTACGMTAGCEITEVSKQR